MARPDVPEGTRWETRCLLIFAHLSELHSVAERVLTCWKLD